MLTISDVRSTYVGSSIGFFWTVVKPILDMVIYTFAFNVLLGVRFHPTGNTAHYILFLFCGMMAWNGFAEGVSRATTSITQSGHLLRKLNFPAIVLPAHVVLSATFHQSLRLALLLPAIALVGPGLRWLALLVPLYLAVQLAFTLGVGLLLSTLQVYFRDVAHWVSAALTLGMFLTPIFYPASAWPRQFVLLLYPNPIAQLIGIYQAFLLDHNWVAVNQLLFPFIAAALALGVGASVFAHNRQDFPDQV